MGFRNGNWVTDAGPNQVDYPFSLAAKGLLDCKRLSQEEFCTLIHDTRHIYDVARRLSRESLEYKRDLRTCENTVRFLQITEAL